MSAEMPPKLDAVVSDHMNPFGSGVARFNQVLAGALGVPCLSLRDPRADALDAPLLSFKVAELDAGGRDRVAALRDGYARRGVTLRLFLHDYAGLALEDELVGVAATVYCGNREIRERLDGHGAAELVEAWAPGLIADQRRFEPAEVSVFSFGMAHKLRIDMFARLRDLLDATERSYAVRISSATHETSSIEDEQVVFEQMRAIFPRRVYFMGHLSDVAVYNELLDTTFFATFFRDGARANNTSLASAMEHGAVVITNLDEYSPPELVHMHNVIDLERCDELPTDVLTLRRISVHAMETARERSWARLVDMFHGREGAPG
jgi:hypothetical protein